MSKREEIPSSQITPEALYRSRRSFIQGAALASVGLGTAAACRQNTAEANGWFDKAEPEYKSLPELSNLQPGAPVDRAGGETPTEYDDITSYNNYYEFSTDKEKVKELAANFPLRPWSVRVHGLVAQPATFDIDDLLKRLTQQQRIYRLRCVEAWSMVVPWAGFPLHELLALVQPTSEAKYVKFTSVLNKAQMPGQRSGGYPWPYVEGLRLDEATHDLTLMATGLYGKALTPQNGGPLRLVVPWKYGFKSIKGVVDIELVAEQPTSLWMALASDEYGFYANVNPTVQHPRWSQSSERRIGELTRRRTLMFNGYGAEVEALYQGMDLTKFF